MIFTKCILNTLLPVSQRQWGSLSGALWTQTVITWSNVLCLSTLDFAGWLTAYISILSRGTILLSSAVSDRMPSWTTLAPPRLAKSADTPKSVQDWANVCNVGLVLDRRWLALSVRLHVIAVVNVIRLRIQCNLVVCHFVAAAKFLFFVPSQK